MVDTRDRLLGTHLLGQNSRDDVAFLLVIDGNKQICLAHDSLSQGGKRGTITLNGEQVSHCRNVFQELAIALNHSYFVVIAAEHTCQMATDITGTRNNNLHIE